MIPKRKGWWEDFGIEDSVDMRITRCPYMTRFGLNPGDVVVSDKDSTRQPDKGFFMIQYLPLPIMFYAYCERHSNGSITLQTDFQPDALLTADEVRKCSFLQNPWHCNSAFPRSGDLPVEAIYRGNGGTYQPPRTSVL
jgi:hypothetical protein